MTAGIDRIYALAWKTEQLGEALEVTARRARLLRQPQEAPQVPPELQSADPDALNRWIVLAADTLGIEAEPVVSAPAALLRLAQEGAPAIVQLPARSEEDEARYLALLGHGTRPQLIAPDLRVHRVDAVHIAQALSRGAGAEWLPFADALLDAAQVPAPRRARARWQIVQQQLDPRPMPCGWLLRLAPGAPLLAHMTRGGLWGILGQLVAAQALQLALLVLVWWFIGFVTLTSVTNFAWLQAWALVLFTTVPVQWWLNHAQSAFAAQLGLIFRQRLLYGTLQLRPDEIRHQGLGQFLERVMMSENIEMLAVGGGLLALLALLQLGVALWVMLEGAGGAVHAATLIALVALTFAIGWNYYRTKRAWVINYRQLTNRLVERLIGHRTRLAQQDPRAWHAGEDAELERYVNLTTRFDSSFVPVGPLPWLWMIASLAGLLPAFLTGAVTVTSLAIALGGILLAFNALTMIVNGISTLVNSMIASEQVLPLFEAASRYAPISPTVLEQSWRKDGEPQRAATLEPTPLPDLPARPLPLLRARNLVFRYRPQGRAILNEVSLDIYAGDRLLLEGPSGGGKTTLAAVLAGLRVPQTGLVLLRGFDRQNVESQVTPRRIAMAPQFHENYIFNATFAFNLLLGRRYPPTEQDLAEAEAVCRELGLDELLARMPLGMNQIVGESGWQLSHGERSRVYIARVLLQPADLVILDESFGALDPENLRDALQTTLRRAPTLMVIAHP